MNFLTDSVLYGIIVLYGFFCLRYIEPYMHNVKDLLKDKKFTEKMDYKKT